jgi:NADPH:quinone reductase-like Zn-dependent oxidoreductase
VFVLKMAGASVWAGVRAEQKAVANSVGADHVVVIDRDAEMAALPTFDAICDTVGGDTIGKLLSHLRMHGVLGTTLGEPPGAREAGVRVTAIRTQPDSRRLSELAQAAAEGRLVVPVQRTFPLEKAPDAFALARQGGVGKVLLLP